MLDVNGWEVIVLAVVGILVLGPERLPEYAVKLAGFVRQARGFATERQDPAQGADGARTSTTSTGASTTRVSTTRAGSSARR